MRLVIILALYLIFTSGLVLADVPTHLLPVVDDIGLTPEQIVEKNALLKRISRRENDIQEMESKLAELINIGRDPDSAPMKEFKADIELNKKDMNKAKVDLSKIKSDLDKGKLAQAKNELAQIAKLKLDGKLSDAKFQLLSLAVQLNSIERDLDNKIQGEYLRTKFARLLSNSRAMCAAVDVCQKGNPIDYGKANELLNDVFHNESGNLGREAGTGKEKKSPVHEMGGGGTF